MTNKFPIELPLGNETILHLSDLHFGSDGSNAELSHRQLALDSLIETVELLDASWRPSIICITGDIGWLGKAPDYQPADEWFKKLSLALGVPLGNFVMCPGNHDLDRDKRTLTRTSNYKEAAAALDQLTIPSTPFADYAEFCERIGVPPFEIADSKSYLVGTRRINGVLFCALNSAWFSADNADKNNLWLGYPHLLVLQKSGQLPADIRNCAETVVSLLHHPFDWLADDEVVAPADRRNTIDHLSWSSDLILSGHTHGEVRLPDQRALSAYHFTSGATFESHEPRHLNSFRLIRLAGRFVQFRSYELPINSPQSGWKLSEIEDSFELLDRTIKPTTDSLEFTFYISKELLGLEEIDRRPAIHDDFNAFLKRISLDTRLNLDDSKTPITVSHDQLGTASIVFEPGSGTHDGVQNPYIQGYVKTESNNVTLLNLLLEIMDRPYQEFRWKITELIDLEELAHKTKAQAGWDVVITGRKSSVPGIESYFETGHHFASDSGRQLHFRIATFKSHTLFWVTFNSDSTVGGKPRKNLDDGLFNAHRLLTPTKFIKAVMGDLSARQRLQLLRESCKRA